MLQAMSEAAGPAFHPNVLGYLDNWEQDKCLFILTELCEFGNFAHFLAEYGHHFARLDEARVWKIFADISSVSRLVFLCYTARAHVVRRACSSFTMPTLPTLISSRPISS